MNEMNDTSYGKAALKKMGEVPENFFIYQAGWLEDNPKDFDTMEVKGAVFRAALRGKNKGKICVMVKGTEKTVFIQSKDMERFK